jgi:hypothetical protein
MLVPKMAGPRQLIEDVFRTRMRIAVTGATGLEPATSGVTGRRSNQLSYAPRGWATSARR